MLLRMFVVIGFLAFLTTEVYPQKIVRDHGFFKNLLQDSVGVLDIWAGLYGVPGNIDIPDMPFKTIGSPPKKLVRNKNGLFMSLDGTGRVYRVNRKGEDLDLVRIDSTVFFGYNFGSYFFTHNDTLYSYGGYGYWQINGHLRFFDSKKAEWEIKQVSREITAKRTDPDFDYSIWFDHYSGRLFVMNSSSHPDSVYALDMSTRRWQTLGKRIPSPNYYYRISTPWGMLCASRKSQAEFVLLDVRTNSIHTLNKAKTEWIASADYGDASLYARDSTLVFTDRFNPEGINTITLSRRDFTPTGNLIYEPVQTPSVVEAMMSSMFAYWYVVVAVGFGFGLGVLTTRRKSHKNIQITNGTEKQNGHGKNSIFEAREKDLIRFVLKKSGSNEKATIEEINHILGVSEKPQDLQKKHRSDIISSINTKYRYITGNTESLVSSTRSVYDKRSFEYYIDKAIADDVKMLVG